MKGRFRSRTVKLKGYPLLIIFSVLVLLDRLTKIWASTLKEPIDMGLLSITYVTNTGGGFSILSGMNILFIIISILALAALIYFHKQVPLFSNVLLCSGIAGNLIDRIAFGAVIDFINFRIWPIFNIADSLIFIGVAYWVYVLIRTDRIGQEQK